MVVMLTNHSDTPSPLSQEVPEAVVNEEALEFVGKAEVELHWSRERQDLKDQDVWDLNRARELWHLDHC